MNILITGADGQLAKAIRIAELSTETENKYIYARHRDLSITDADAVDAYVRDNSIDVIVNCAAYTNVEKAEDLFEFANAFAVNMEGPNNLANAAKKNDAVLIHISTDYVFDGKSNVPYVPESKPGALSTYGNSKYGGEMCIEVSKCKHIIIRTSWLYSERGNNFVTKMYGLMKSNGEVKAVIDQTGSPTYAQDLADFIVHIIENNKLSHFGTYHFANLGSASRYDIIESMSRIAMDAGELDGCKIVPCRSSEFNTKAKRPPYSVLDTESLRTDFDYDIPSWQKALKRCMVRMFLLDDMKAIYDFVSDRKNVDDVSAQLMKNF